MPESTAAAPEGHGHPGPDLTFTVAAARPASFTAVPTLEFRIAVAGGGGPVRSVLLSTAVRIAPARRRHDQATRDRLAEVFGNAQQWASGIRPLALAQVTTVLPPFEDTTTATLPVPCGSDIELAVTKYLRAVPDGDIPLDFLFSGTVFHDGPDGRLRTARISWAGDATYRLPVGLWQQTVHDSGWVRLSRDDYDRLDAYRARHALTSWDETVRALLEQNPRPAPDPSSDAAGATWTPWRRSPAPASTRATCSGPTGAPH
ncbi:DUF6084 family protein [Peterkaempfera sp. SMS 1(5)a]|uniref:DUF6084 family protein n=1 Tax=Peterkaempfera podocarpi TaxID=3232308 RepID=UPI0036733646